MDNATKQTSVWEVLGTVKVDMKIGENAGRSDQMFYQHLQEGMQENDLDKVYEFIDAMERGCGLSIDENIHKLMNKAYEENPLRLGELIAARNSLIDYWIFLSYCTSEIICELIAIETEYTLFYYECARLLLQKIKIDNGYRVYIVKAVKKFAMRDCELWKRWNNKNEYNIEWQKSVGEVLAGLTEESLIIYANTIHLDIENRNDLLRIITEAFQNIPDDCIEHILSVISEDICLRWKNYIQIKKEQKKFQSDITISVYINIILWSMETLMKEKDIWEKEFVANAETLEKDMYEWYENKSQMISVFFIDVTQIFYLLFLKKSELSDMKTEAILNATYKIRMLMKRFDVFWNKNAELKTEMESLLNLI